MWLPLLVLAAAPAWPVPSLTEIDGCRAAACTAREEVKICKCIPQGEGRPGLVLEGPGSRHLEWDARAVDGTVTDFFVRSQDLDRDGKPELLIASRAAESGTLPVEDWELALVDGENGGVTHLLAQDFGPDALSLKGTLLLTEWALEGGQIAFTGREYAYDGGRLVPLEVPVRRRPLSPGFQKARAELLLASGDRSLQPRSFLAHASTRAGVDVFPRTAPSVVIKGVAREEPWLQLHLQSARGALETLSGNVEGEGTLRLGDAKTKRLFPLGYAPADAEAWLLGRAVWQVEGQVWVR